MLDELLRQPNVFRDTVALADRACGHEAPTPIEDEPKDDPVTRVCPRFG